MGLLLTKEERNRFASWCEMQAESNAEIIEQMKRIKIPDNVVKYMKDKIPAYLIVANELRSIEEEIVPEKGAN